MRKQEQRRHRSRALWVTLLASLALHGLAALLLSRAKPPPPLSRTAPPLEVTVIERSHPTPSPAPAATPKPPPRTRTVRRPSPPTSPEPPAPVASAKPGATAPEPAPPKLSSDVPYAPPSGPRDAPVLTPSPGALAQGGDTAVGPPEEVPEDAPGIQAPRHVTPEQLVRETAQDALALSRGKRGMVHPYFQKLGQALFDAWRPEPVVAKLGSETLRSRGYGLQDFASSWQKRAEAYGKTGSPLSGVALGNMPRVLGGTDLSSSFSTQIALESQASSDTLSKRRMVMRLTQDRTGRLLELRLLKPSALPEVDRGALADLRAAGARLPEPPQDALGPRTQLVSLWELELVGGWNSRAKEVSFDFAGAIADTGFYKHLKLAGAQ